MEFESPRLERSSNPGAKPNKRVPDDIGRHDKTQHTKRIHCIKILVWVYIPAVPYQSIPVSTPIPAFAHAYAEPKPWLGITPLKRD